MAEELSRGISDKLHPQLRLVLRALKTFRKQNQISGLIAACSGLGANLLYAIQDFPHRERYTELPVAETNLAPASMAILTREIIQFSRCLKDSDKANREALKAAPDIFADFSPTTAAKFAQKVEREALPQGKVCAGLMAKTMRSLRSNRDPSSAFQKLAHATIFMFLFPCGVLKNTESDYSLQGPFGLDEVTEIFNYACPACCEPHSSEALRKSAARFKTYILRHWPSDSIRGDRSHPRKIRIRVTGIRPYSSEHIPCCEVQARG